MSLTQMYGLTPLAIAKHSLVAGGIEGVGVANLVVDGHIIRSYRTVASQCQIGLRKVCLKRIELIEEKRSVCRRGRRSKRIGE